MNEQLIIQRIQDEQGHVVVWSEIPRKKGDVIDWIHGLYTDFETLVVIVGEATFEEHQRQNERFTPEIPNYPAPYYYKAIAE